MVSRSSILLGTEMTPLFALAASSDTPVVLVSADRQLAERVRQSGAEVVGPSWLLDRLPP